jgi:hypothetical protein
VVYANRYYIVVVLAKLSLSYIIEYISYTTYVVIEGYAFEVILIQSNLA